MDNKTRQRLKLIVLFLLFVGPLLIAWVWYQNTDVAWLKPGTVNHGTLIQPPSPLMQASIQTAAGDLPLQRKWTLVIAAPECGQACVRALYVTRQVRIALGKDSERVQRLLLSQSRPALDLAKTQPDLSVKIGNGLPLLGQLQALAPDGEAHIFLVDPLGNAMMWYSLDVAPADLHDDLKRLMRYSQTG